jgi:hypothetical protein
MGSRTPAPWSLAAVRLVGGGVFASISATPDEVAAPRAGDDIVPAADVVMDRAFTVDASLDAIWPWLLQLGKGRAGWYLPRSVERFVPRGRRATRRLHDTWQHLVVGDVIPDYGGRDATFEVAVVRAPTVLVYRSQRGRTHVSWSITVTPLPDSPGRSRVHLRLRLARVRHRWLAETAGDFFDALTIAGMAAGLRERLGEPPP